MWSITIIIPALNEAATLEATLLPLQSWRKAGHQLILVDGGSWDGTASIALSLVDRVLTSTPGRALQMNLGAEAACGDLLLFLHADTRLPPEADRLILRAVEHRPWGRFDVRLSGGHWLLRAVERMMNWRSCLSGIATGDQGIFIERELFERIGGFPELPLMEDIVLSKRLKRAAGRPACIHTPLVTSSRRWEQNGILRTILLMWRLRLAFFIGVPANRLVRHYRHNEGERATGSGGAGR
jgi:rSAM/selenodomain-associated transferase 2